MRKYKMPNLLANQWCSLWKNYSLIEKMKRDGEINMLVTGGNITHHNIDGSITSAQAKNLINMAVNNNASHFALNSCYIECQECGHVHKGKFDACPECGSKKLNFFSRIIGYFSKVNNWSKDRRENDWPNRVFTTQKELDEQLKS